VSGALDLLRWPAAFVLLFAATFLGFTWIGGAFPSDVNNILTAAGVTSLAGSVLYARSGDLRFWLIRVRARFLRGVAPAWKIRVAYRARVGPSDLGELGDVLRRTHSDARVTAESDKRIAIEAGGSRLIVEWVQPLDEPDRGLRDWEVQGFMDHPSVQYHDSVRFLRRVVMPLLEGVESALEVVGREYRLVVEYGHGGNPFEGLVVRSAPGQAITSYDFLLAAGPGERIHMSKDRLDLSASSRSRFEEIVESLLALGGALQSGGPITTR
jgi:hypothetical protein